MDDSQVCPLLGLSDERGAYLTYPSYENRCYASSPHQAIALNEQTFFCLGGHRERCPRFQAWQAQHPEETEEAVDLAAAAALAETADTLGEEEPPSPWARPVSESSDFVWQEGEAEDDELDLDEEELPISDSAPPPPPPPPVAPATPLPAPRRPVWPLLLAAGTLVSVLMLCGLISAFWIGWQTLSARLALNPTPSPIIEQETAQPGVVPITATLPPVGVVVIVPSPTAMQETQPMPSPTFEGVVSTPTPELFSPTPTSLLPTLLPTATATWTPRATPTTRATPTFFPTSTPVRTFTPTFTPVGTTRTSTVEPFSVSFTANPTIIDFGQSSTLSWNVRGVRAIYLDGDPVSGPTGSKRVTPNSTTTYVLRIVKVDGSVQEETQTVTVRVPSPTSTPTSTPTHTPTPSYSIRFNENRSTALIDGTNCQTGNGCAVFQVQVSNTGNRNTKYFFIKSANQQPGWSSFFCWGSNCEFGASPRPRTLDANSLETASLNYLLPAIVRDGETDTITVLGYYCEEDETCPPEPLNPARRVYEQTFRITIQIPTPTPNLSQTPTTTPTQTPTDTATATATATATTAP